ncbi:DUF4810 domain-containing protein [Salinisphaera aquimarina]|uniref:DUF4810 domain-containing protein n=1 Tax=Salinisphaera aquimarina TaxID=2094031 RepID=A0ABV7EMG7_9GAMM
MSDRSFPLRSLVFLGVLLLTALTVTGCASQGKQPLYRWGGYQSLIYQQYVKPGTAEPGIQVDKLSADIERTQAEGKRVPPGEHAHLGYMQYQIGNTDQAVQEFQVERNVYPESATLMDRLINRARAGGGS